MRPDGDDTAPRRPRVLIVDDHPVVRAGVRAILEEDGRSAVVAEARDVAGALAAVVRERPDVVVLDLSLGGPRSGLDVIPELRAAGARIVILSVQDEPAYAQRAFARGAIAYVLKDAADEQLADAVAGAAAGTLYVHPRIAANLLLRPPAGSLTERQREIVRLLALGYTNQQVADELYLSVRTIEAHRRHVMRALRLASRAELVRYAVDHGLVRLTA